MIFLQRTFTSLVHAHAGRTQDAQTDKLQSARARASHILANRNLPLSLALFGNTKLAKYLFVKAVFLKLVWWVTPQFSPTRFGVQR